MNSARTIELRVGMSVYYASIQAGDHGFTVTWRQNGRTLRANGPTAFDAQSAARQESRIIGDGSSTPY